MEIRMDFTFLRGNNLSASLCSAPPLDKGRRYGVRIPRLPLSRGAGAQRLRGYPAAAAHGFPYEGKLSPEATDEVDSVA